MLEREPNNTIATAQNLGGILRSSSDRTTRTQTIDGSTSGSDTDFFRFLPGNQASSTVTLSLSNPNANIQLFRDSNFNRQIDPGELIDSTLGKTSKRIVLEGAGDDEFYVSASKGGAAASYKLDITVAPGVGRESEPNNTPNQADNLGRLNGFRNFEGSVNVRTDARDFYAFRLDSTRSVSLSVFDKASSATADVDIRLYRDANNNRQIDAGELIASGTESRFNDSISSRQLGSGNYLAEVIGAAGNVNYRLNMSAIN